MAFAQADHLDGGRRLARPPNPMPSRPPACLLLLKHWILKSTDPLPKATIQCYKHPMLQ